jgi:hypothetical protein
MEDKLDKNSLIEKIQKLMNLSNGTSFGPEADAAKRKVAKLMGDYAISMSEVLNFEVPDEVFIRMDVKGMTFEDWEGTLAQSIAFCFDSRVVVSQTKGLIIHGVKLSERAQTFFFVGTKSDLELSTHFFKFLRRTVGKKADSAFMRKDDRTTYAMSMSIELGKRLEELYKLRNENASAEIKALVIVKKNGAEDMLKKLFPDAKSRDIKLGGSREAWFKGHEDAKSISLLRPIADKGTRAAQIEG